MRVLHYNCPAGLSGDMNLGAMVDLGVDPAALESELKKLPLDGWEISFQRDLRKGISGTRCDVHYEEHSHADNDHHHHHHRTFAQIRKLIEASALSEAIKADAIAVFHSLAEAEAAVHDKSIDDIHFHEVGAVDSIIDIVGAAICWNLLEVDAMTASTLELGGGTVKCAHGLMPVPAPATARLVKNFPVSMGGTDKEATTPTGAALLAGKQCTFGSRIEGKALATGIGIGQRDDPSLANVVYVSLIESDSTAVDNPGSVVELVTNLDDMPGEKVAFLMDLLLQAGALDTWQVPATFKKGRLGCELHILANHQDREAFMEMMFRHSTTLGIRWRDWNRCVLQRKLGEVVTPMGTVRKKSALRDGKILRFKYEYDDLRSIALNNNLSLADVEEMVKQHDV